MKFRFLLETLLEDIDDVKRQYSYIPEEDFEKIIRLDPTFKERSNSVGKYGKWLLGLYRKDNPLEHSGIYNLLSEYDSKKNDRNFNIEKDVGKFKSIVDLAGAVENAAQAELSHRQEVRNRQQARKNADLSGDADIVYEDDDWIVYVPKTYEASCKLGQGSRWCTASTESRREFDYYMGSGNLYININKHDPEDKYQFHFQEGQFMDKYNHEIGIGDFLAVNPGLASFYDREGLYAIPPKPDENGLLIYNGGEVLARYAQDIKEVIVEDGVTTIREYAFYYCTELTSITIPSSVTKIEDSAFKYCTSLTSITIPSSVTKIGSWAFYYCTRLTSVTFDAGSQCTNIGDNAFRSCWKLTSISIPSSVTSIKDYVFSNCTSLTSITIPSSVTSIGIGAFEGCRKLTTITIPSSVTRIMYGALSDCSSLTSVNIPSSVEFIGPNAFEYSRKLTIHCKKDSYAEEYAREYRIPVKYV